MSKLLISDLGSLSIQQIDEKELSHEEQNLVFGGLLCLAPGTSMGSYAGTFGSIGAGAGALTGAYFGGFPGLALGAGLGFAGGVGGGMLMHYVCSK
jgi:hypothetical protein